MADLVDDPPDFYVCPITRQVMEYPFLTVAGNCYEYYAICDWLKTNDTDPASNARLLSKRLVPNHGLRSQIQAWFDGDSSNAVWRNTSAPRPPAEAYQLQADDGLQQILRYKGKQEASERSRKDRASGKTAEGSADDKTASTPVVVPAAFTAFGHSYTFSTAGPVGPGANTGLAPALMISCDGGAPTEMPDRCVFAVSNGLVFFDPKELREARVLPGTDLSAACTFAARCSRDDCTYSHPFVCAQGVSCTRQGRGCKFSAHPGTDSVVPVSSSRQTVCKYGTSCTRPDCWFAHPLGRTSVRRIEARILITHSHKLEELATPLQVALDLSAANCFQMQGEFVCSFRSYAGTWAKRHFQVVTVHRFDVSASAYKVIGDYSLEKHYCNSAAAAGRHIVLSFWPYEEEAVRTIWGCLRVTRSLESELRKKDKECTELKQELEAKNTTIERMDKQLQQAKQDARVARDQAYTARQQRRKAQQEAAQARREAHQAESKWRRMQQNQERERTERLRLRDPIHIYALQKGESGAHRAHWRMVVDYHKGAHEIELGALRPDGTQQVSFTVHSTVLRFDLVTPQDVAGMPLKLPLQPPLLCADF